MYVILARLVHQISRARTNLRKYAWSLLYQQKQSDWVGDTVANSLTCRKT